MEDASKTKFLIEQCLLQYNCTHISKQHLPYSNIPILTNFDS